MQTSAGLITNFAQHNQEVFQSVSVSVLGCLQTEFKASEIRERVEKSLVVGLRRSAGLNLLDYTMSLNAQKPLFFDLLQWFQSGLRNNRS